MVQPPVQLPHTAIVRPTNAVACDHAPLALGSHLVAKLGTTDEGEDPQRQGSADRTGPSAEAPNGETSTT